MRLSRTRFTVRSLCAVVAVTAVGLAIVKFINPYAGNVARYVTLSFLVTATYHARYGHGHLREWSFGFALFGWAYYLLSVDSHAAWVWNRSSQIYTFPSAVG